ncbi:Na/Pi cotransporter family protein [Waltera intestinalis]|jgi:Na/Pi-cotransporter II-like protein|uniref:Na/Pi cotransporter family protein n=1 Tax=Waltera intestinalis TaxID=2606635 RepID=A0A6L5YID5_9FIRM|nr:Na/Pi cotransporter family protein [Waltera intestinalis]MCI6470020.1 Na/Pi cotransporter family protein [Lachnospiraceae bacterium]MCI6517574.1 Na/Pi cotransporter family protein [Lachnospiraceae bacterium]MST57638.1 Na/Pi cotransporter family protein [Waltera intestinalis]
MSFGTILTMAGGLGLFLFGMELMSDSIEKVAGARLRRILEIFTTNRFMGMIVGIIFTGIIQSSSACTVMVVSFVNSGLMNLYQAAGVILGANIGTTITSQLVSFNLSKIAPLILLVGVVVMMFTKKEKVRKVAEVVVGFGILFVGLSTMSQAMANMKNEPQVVNLLMSLKNPFLATLMGFALTAIIQSSSVTVSIVLLLANQDLLPLPITLYIILGCNIGACATAMLASMTGKKDAKRAALIHLLFNIIGTVIIYIALFVAGDQIVELIKSISADNGRFVANAHTLIKIAQVIMLFPFTGWLVKMTYLIVPGEDQKVGYRESYQLKYIGDKVVFNPATAVVEVVKELERMASLAEENLNRAMNALITLDEEDIEEVYEVEKNINFLNHAITDYLVKINQTTLPIEDLNSLGALFHVVNDIERIGDHAENVADAARQRKEEGVSISKEAQKELGDMLEMVNKIIRYAVEMFAKSDETHMQEIITLEDQVDEKERELQKKHVERLTKGECSPEAGMIFSDIVSGLERVADHATNIAFAITTEDEMDEGKTN